MAFGIGGNGEFPACVGSDGSMMCQHRHPKIKALAVFIFSVWLAVSAFASELKTYTFSGWQVKLSGDLKVTSTSGVDYKVTSFLAGDNAMTAVFYYGMHPNLQAASAKGVTTNNDKLAGQEVTWSLWREINEGKAFHCAEVVFRAKPGTNRQDLIHVLMSARTNEQVEALRTALQEMKQKSVE
jgi:hypothetical protein